MREFLVDIGRTGTLLEPLIVVSPLWIYHLDGVTPKVSTVTSPRRANKRKNNNKENNDEGLKKHAGS